MKLTNDQLDSILAESGLRMNQPYSPKQSYRKDEDVFTQCLTCGIEAHYRLKYILEKKASTCRACYWRNWHEGTSGLYNESIKQLIEKGATRRELIDQGIIEQEKDASWNDAESLVLRYGYELVDVLHGGTPGNDVLVVKCKACGRQTAERPCDIEFGCTCNKSNLKSSGIAFGTEAVTVDTPLEDRDIAPRTPGAKGLEQWIERRESKEIACEFSRVKNMTCADFPELMAAWNDVRNPFDVSAATPYNVHLICQNGHHPNQTPFSFLSNGCMICRGLKTKTDPNKEYLDVTNPELAAEWDSAIDGERYTPHNVGSGSKRKVQWRCIACGGTWIDTVRNRELRMNNRCPHCSKIMGSLAWKYPNIARIWSSDNPISPWNTKPFGTLDFKPEWVCPDNPHHTWRENTQSVIKKNGKCPYCG